MALHVHNHTQKKKRSLSRKCCLRWGTPRAIWYALYQLYQLKNTSTCRTALGIDSGVRLRHVATAFVMSDVPCPPTLAWTLTISLDFDWLYRKGGPDVIGRCAGVMQRFNARVHRVVVQGYKGVSELARHWHGEHSRLGGVETVGTTIAIALFVFALMLVWDLLTTLD